MGWPLKKKRKKKTQRPIKNEASEDEIKNNFFLNEPKKDQSQLVLTFKTRNPSHETEINPIEGKKEKEKEKITIKKILKDEIEKTNIIKKIKKTIIKRTRTKFDIKIN